MLNREAVKKEILTLKTYQEIADIFGVSRERIRQIARMYGLQGHRKNLKKQEKNNQYEKRLQARFGSFYENGVVTEKEWYDACRLKFTTKKAQVLYQSPWDWNLDFIDLVWPKFCPVLGIELNYFSKGRSENSPSFDRIDSNLGYIKGNVVVMSWRANRLKNNGTAEEHEKIANYLRNS